MVLLFPKNWNLKLTFRAYQASLAVPGQRWRNANCGDEVRLCVWAPLLYLFFVSCTHQSLGTDDTSWTSIQLVSGLEHWALSLLTLTITHHVCPCLPCHWRDFDAVMLFCFLVCPQHPAWCQLRRMFVCVCVCVCVSIIIHWMSKWGQVLGILIICFIMSFAGS